MERNTEPLPGTPSALERRANFVDDFTAMSPEAEVLLEAMVVVPSTTDPAQVESERTAYVFSTYQQRIENLNVDMSKLLRAGYMFDSFGGDVEEMMGYLQRLVAGGRAEHEAEIAAVTERVETLVAARNRLLERGHSAELADATAEFASPVLPVDAESVITRGLYLSRHPQMCKQHHPEEQLSDQPEPSQLSPRRKTGQHFRPRQGVTIEGARKAVAVAKAVCLENFFDRRTYAGDPSPSRVFDWETQAPELMEPAA